MLSKKTVLIILFSVVGGVLLGKTISLIPSQSIDMKIISFFRGMNEYNDFFGMKNWHILATFIGGGVGVILPSGKKKKGGVV